MSFSFPCPKHVEPPVWWSIWPWNLIMKPYRTKFGGDKLHYGLLVPHMSHNMIFVIYIFLRSIIIHRALFTRGSRTVQIRHFYGHWSCSQAQKSGITPETSRTASTRAQLFKTFKIINIRWLFKKLWRKMYPTSMMKNDGLHNCMYTWVHAPIHVIHVCMLDFSGQDFSSWKLDTFFFITF